MILAILIPTGILAFLSVKSFRDDDVIMRDEIQKRAETISLGMKGIVEEQFRTLEEMVDQEILSSNIWDSISRKITGDQQVPLIKHTFIIDKDYALLEPEPPWSNEIPGPAGRKAITLQFAAAFDRIEAKEIQGALKDSLSAYSELLSLSASPTEKAIVLNAIARTHAKRGDWKKAVTVYRRIIKEFPGHTSPNGNALAIVAYLKCVRISLDQKNPSAAQAYATGLLSDICSRKIACTRTQVLFAIADADDWLKAFHEAKSIDAATYKRLLARVQQLCALEDTAGRLEQEGGIERCSAMSYSYIDLSESEIVGVRWLSDQKDKAAVFSVDTRLFKEHLAAVIRTTFAYSDAFHYEIMSSDNELFLASAKNGLDSPDRRLSLPEGLPLSQIALQIAQPEALRKNVDRRRQMNIAMIGILFTVIGVSLIYLLRLMGRENELSSMKTNFVSSVSHEMRIPLATIRMVGEMFQLKKVTSEKQAEEYYGILTGETERLTRLIGKVLDFSRMESGRNPYNLEYQDIGPIILKAVHRFEQSAENVTIKTDVQGALPQVAVDQDSLMQVLFNLMDNALKYSPIDATIQVSLYLQNDSVILDVTDNGIGMESRTLARIFERFYRAEDELTREAKGTGVGLAIVKHIIHAHNAEIKVKSTRGKGSTFSILFPVA